MIFLKRFVKLYFLIIIFDFMIFGMSFIYHFHYTFIFTLYIYSLYLLSRAKLRYLHFDELTITYKKYTILFTDINSVEFIKLINSNSISINYTSKKKLLALSYLPGKSFIKLKDLIIQKIDSSKIKTRNMVFLQIFYPFVITLFFIISLFLGYNIPKIEFNQNLLISNNINTEHFSFNVEELKFETDIYDNLNCIITEKGLVYYHEYTIDNIHSIETFISPYVNVIDYWYCNDIGILNRFIKFSQIKMLQPILLVSDDFKGVLIEPNINTKLINISNMNDDLYLRISFSKQYSKEDIVEVLKTVSCY